MRQLEEVGRSEKPVSSIAEARLSILRQWQRFAQGSRGHRQLRWEQFKREVYRGRIRLPEEAYRHMPTSLATIYRWKRAYQQRGIAGLEPGRPSGRVRILEKHPEVLQYFLSLFRENPEIRAREMHRQLLQAFPELEVSERTVARYLDDLRGL